MNKMAPPRRTDGGSARASDRTSLVDAVVFDYGGVLTNPVRETIAAWLERDDIESASFSRTVEAWLERTAPEETPIWRLEVGELSVDEFNVLLAAELVSTTGGAVAPQDLLVSMFAEMRPDPVMFDLVQDLKNAEVRVALLSNSWGNTYPRDQIDALFDLVVISGEVGMRKPNPDIFVYALDLLGVGPERVVFVDDTEPNVEGAAQLGMRTVLHTNPDDTRRELSRLVPALDKCIPRHKEIS